MKQLVDKVYNLFSQQLAKWFILAGMVCFGLMVFISFLSNMIDFPQEAFYYIVVFAFGALICAGLFTGHYLNKEPVLVVAFLAYIFMLLYQTILSDTWGASFLANAGVPYILHWVFELIYSLAVAAFVALAFLVYLFKFRKLKFALEISYLAALGFGFLAWIFNIVYAANGGGWTIAVVPLFQVCSLLMVPGLLEELLPGELDAREESEAAE